MKRKLHHTQTTSELIAEGIRNAIIKGDFEIGKPLKQDVLAEQYGVSKIPVREALNQLKIEGLADFQNNRGAVVSSLSLSEVEEIYTMRIALEQIALERAIPNIQIANTIAAESALKLADASTNPLDWASMNWHFHASLYKAADMPKLLDTVSILHNNVVRYLVLYLKKLNHQSSSQVEHWALLAACSAGKTDQAIDILQKHLQGALKQTLEYMRYQDTQK
ncbi:MAG: DNA-binding GntR family transcriptional regulator [Flavobacterium sp.]|jgi:DNA-binding GntR family transcriptional regulator